MQWLMALCMRAWVHVLSDILTSMGRICIAVCIPSKAHLGALLKAAVSVQASCVGCQVAATYESAVEGTSVARLGG